MKIDDIMNTEQLAQSKHSSFIIIIICVTGNRQVQPTQACLCGYGCSFQKQTTFCFSPRPQFCNHQAPQSVLVSLIPLCSLPGSPTKPSTIFCTGPRVLAPFPYRRCSQALAPWRQGAAGLPRRSQCPHPQVFSPRDAS